MQLPSETQHKGSQSTQMSVVYEDGYWWWVVSDRLWDSAEFVEWTDGYPWYTRRQ